MGAIVRKELADYFNSIRFIILFALFFLAAAAALFAAFQGIRGANLPEGFVFLGLYTTAGESLPSLASMLTLIIPIVGIALGFDAINSERAGGTLSRIVSQPIYRDSIINGKFIAAVVTMAIMVGTTLLLVAGYGLRMIGVPPSAEEIIRLFLYFVTTLIYGAFWLGLGIFFSVLLRRVAASLLITLSIWLFFSFFMMLIAPAIANSIAPYANTSTEAEIIRNVEIQQMVMLFSPSTLFSMATQALLLPVAVGSFGVVTQAQTMFMMPNPLGLGQSLLLIWPHLTSLVGLSIICFAVSYVLFMRQEVRAT